MFHKLLINSSSQEYIHHKLNFLFNETTNKALSQKYGTIRAVKDHPFYNISKFHVLSEKITPVTNGMGSPMAWVHENDFLGIFET